MEEIAKDIIFNKYNIKPNGIHLSYNGPFTKDTYNLIGNYIKLVFEKQNTESHRKLFRIFIELATNISKHSGLKRFIPELNEERGVGTLIIYEEDDVYKFIIGNILNTKDTFQIEEISMEINKLDQNKLRELRRKKRGLEQGDDGAAHIGLVQIALISNNPLDYYFEKIDDQRSIFILAISLDKN